MLEPIGSPNQGMICKYSLQAWFALADRTVELWDAWDGVAASDAFEHSEPADETRP